MWRRILALTIKEFLALLKDKRSRVVLIVPPLLQTIVFGYAASMDLNRVPIAVYNTDGGAVARELIARFSGSSTFDVVATIRRDADVRRLIERKQVLAVLRLRPDFSQSLLAGRPAPLQVILDGRNSNTAGIALGYISGIVQQFNIDWVQSHAGAGPPAVLESRAWFNPNLISRWFFAPGIIGILMLVVTMLVTALSVAREREQGTFDQLLVTPLRPVEILIGKSLPGFIVGLGEATVIVLIVAFWFQVPLRGSIALLYTGILLFVLAAVGVGLMISSIARTLQQALLGAFLFMVPAVILSGFATPIANMPPAVQLLTYVNPLRYFLVVVRGIFLEAAPAGLLVQQFWPLAIIGSVTLAAAALLFRRRMS